MGKNDKNLFKLLMNKKIYKILLGDTKLNSNTFFDNALSPEVSMPPLSGARLCEISSTFGLPKVYNWNGGNPSRIQYLEDLFEHCIVENRCSDLLAYLFSKEQFSKLPALQTPGDTDKIYNALVQRIIEEINAVLAFGDHQLVINNHQFSIKKVGTIPEVQTPRIKTIDREYIKSLSSRAMDDIEQKNYDSAITKSRTLLEEVFCYVIEKKKESPITSGKISDLYKQVKKLYNMHQDANTDNRINSLLSGLERIVSSISEMRNKDSDAHGVGSKRIQIKQYHARLFVNASMTMSDFILSVAVNANTDTK